MLSNFLCRPPTPSELERLDNSTAGMCRQVFNGGGISELNYFKCTGGIFRYFILEPMDNYGVIHYGKDNYGILENTELLKCYGTATEFIVVAVMSFYYLTVIFALMRGVLVKYRKCY